MYVINFALGLAILQILFLLEENKLKKYQRLDLQSLVVQSKTLIMQKTFLYSNLFLNVLATQPIAIGTR